MGLRRFLRRAKWDRERLDEIESYLQIETDENIARGMPPEAARAAAHRKLGNSTRIREEIYRMNTIAFIDSLGRDVRYALRALRHNPAFTVIAALTLALGIGATTAIFSVVYGVLVRPLPYPQPEALVGVWHSAAQGYDLTLSAPMYLTYREQNRAFQEFGVWNSGSGNITGIGDPEQVRSLATTKPGVMPASFRFLNLDPEIILPQRFNRSQLPRLDNFNYQGIARLKPGVTLAQANADVARMIPVWVTAYGDANRKMIEAARLAPALRPLKQDVVGDVSNVLWVLMGAVGIVLLTASANVANLLLVRVAGRQQELAIRAALGAGWGRIARQLLVESVMLGVLGGALGLGFSYSGLQLLVTYGPANLPRLTEISMDPVVLALALAVSVLSGLLFALVPVVKYAGPGVATALCGSGRTVSQSRERHRSQNTLVVVQVALALVLLVGSGLMIRSFQALRNVHPGFTRPEQVQMVRVSIPPSQVEEPERVIRMQNDILDRIAGIRGVTSAAFATGLPMEVEFLNFHTVSAEDKTPDGEVPPIRRAKFVSPGLFKTQGTPLIAGRDFTWTDIYENREVAIVSENVARETWGEPSAALGKRIRLGIVGVWHEIVGVARDVYEDGVHRKSSATVYWRAGVQAGLPGTPTRSVPRSVTFAIRSDRTGTETFLAEVREAVWSVNDKIRIFRRPGDAEIVAGE
ncbi:MAG: ABC transporter permease [Acidobacteria bacterium]|nr:ABC transporter permease [Acidobacteriota bacterium]